MKTPAATEITTSALDSANFIPGGRLTPREIRVISTLWKSLSWVSREDVDRIAGASNGPHVVMMLRRKLTGEDGIEMERIDVLDRDGKPSRPGRYRLTDAGRQRLCKLVQQGFETAKAWTDVQGA